MRIKDAAGKVAGAAHGLGSHSEGSAYRVVQKNSVSVGERNGAVVHIAQDDVGGVGPENFHPVAKRQVSGVESLRGGGCV